MQIRLDLGGALSHSGHFRLDRGHSATPRRASDIHCQDVKKIPPPGGVQSWLTIPPTGSTPAVLMLGASTVAHTSRDSPSVTALPPDEGVELADVDSAQDERSLS